MMQSLGPEMHSTQILTSITVMTNNIRIVQVRELLALTFTKIVLLLKNCQVWRYEPAMLSEPSV